MVIVKCAAKDCIHWKEEDKERCIWLGYTLNDKGVVTGIECFNYEEPERLSELSEGGKWDGEQ